MRQCVDNKRFLTLAATLCLLILMAISTALAHDPAGQASSGLEAFVTRLYVYCLGRAPDAEGLANWVDQLQSGESYADEVVYGFVFSPEFINQNLNDEEYVTTLYRALFDREPDGPGLAGWLNAMANGASREEVLVGFTGATEFYNLCHSFGIKANRFDPWTPETGPAPILTSPPDGNQLPLPVVLTWEPVLNATMYSLRINCLDAGINSYPLNPSTTDTSYLLKDPWIGKDRVTWQVTWKVQAVFSDGTYGNFSEEWDFRTK